MQDGWIQFLNDQGATKEANGAIAFGSTADEIAQLQDKPQIISLDYLGIARISGEDAETFLQGQLTNDITQLKARKVQLSGYCNPKGRMLAQFIIMPEADSYLLLLPRSIYDKTINRIKMFILRSKVEITDLRDDFTCIGLAGENIKSEVQNRLPELPEQDFALETAPDYLVCRMPASIPRYLLVARVQTGIDLWSHLANNMSRSGPTAWHWLDIQAGLPVILPETVEEFVPQSVNLELVEGVSFKKGCYTGQEIVARMHYLGKPKRRMFHLQQAEGTPPMPGVDIFDADNDNQSVGQIVNAAPAPGGGFDLLAELKLSHYQKDSLHVGAGDGPLLTLASLPYSPVPDES
jgi:folate-binding protein YgfZ